MPNECTTLRHKRITHSTMNILTGAITSGRVEERVEPCGVPLFSDKERASGTCRSCASGWEVDGNRFATAKETAR
jgi:hypothetical protein